MLICKKQDTVTAVKMPRVTFPREHFVFVITRSTYCHTKPVAGGDKIWKIFARSRCTGLGISIVTHKSCATDSGVSALHCSLSTGR